MTSIGLDILDIGSSKWNNQANESNLHIYGGLNERQFMLPAAANVTLTYEQLIMIACYQYGMLNDVSYNASLQSSVALISVQRRARITTRKSSS